MEPDRGAADRADDAEAWAELARPLGEPGSGMRRYAAAMHLRQRGLLDDAALERYRICAKWDAEDPARAHAPEPRRR